ncbi:MAG: 2-oxo acid dehydrogenase subunit E2 [Chloroflexi bacterium]|nr:2-oxo acid dehydrogenase subunit E2 [Chloroflexota bacterium]MYK61400.1 2-oxo acid dehydrogenase subunit E2 [Chloroflexota bacterium]
MAKLTIDMPHVGESVTEAVIGKWLVSPGDTIRRYDPLVEVVTDKVNMEVPAPRDGTIVGLLVSEGDTVDMGAAIAEMEVEGAVDEQKPVDEPSTDGPSVQAASRVGSMIVGANVGPTGGEFTDTSLQVEQSAAEVARTTGSSSSRRRGRQDRTDTGARISPVVGRLADRHGIDVSQLTGSGTGGRVTKRDVEAYLEATEGSVVPTVDRADEVVEPSPIRRMIAENMSRSFREIPHAWGAVEIDVSGMVAYRNANLERVQRSTGQRLTYLPIVLHHVARALGEHRLLNSSWVDGKVVLKGAVNVGVAVASEQGLVVPVVRGADGLSLEETVSEMARIVEGARAGKLQLEDVQGGTFTLNNTGALGSVLGGAIINYPQAAILTTESIVKRPVVVTTAEGGEAIAIRSMMNMCLSFDHRIIDGAEALTFMNDVKGRLESTSQGDQSR